MRRGTCLVALLTWILTVPFSLAHATLQQDYLNIYLKINDAEHLEKQGDYRGALDDFKDCYAKLAKIHQSDPNWETALVTHRMEDCKAKVLELEPMAAAQAPAPIAPSLPTNTENSATPPPAPAPATATTANDTDEVTSLKLQLKAVKDELQITKDQLKDSQAQLETYRVQLQTVNEQLAALKTQQSSDTRMDKLLSDNKVLTDKLAVAQKELDSIKSNPKSKLVMAQTQLKNLQDQFEASQAANKALQDTTTNLKQQLDQAQADLVAANQKLAAAGPSSAEYQTLKHENEVMRDILTRELQEQAHRDMAKRLAQEEFDNLKLKSKVLQEQLDILGSPMTPPTNDQERELLASLKVPGPDVTAPGNTFTAPASGNPPATPDPSTPATTAASVTPPPVATPDNSTNAVTIASNTATPTNVDMPPPASANVTVDSTTTNALTVVAPAAVPATTPDPAPATVTVASATNTVTDPNAPIPPNTPPGQTAATPVTNTVSTPPAQPAQTLSQIPPGTTTYTKTTIKNGGDSDSQNDPTQWSTKARLPDDMRETAQDAADLFKNQKYDESAAKYQSIIDKYPESLYAWSNLGVVRFQQGKFEDALKALQQAVKLSPTDAFSYSNLGIVYYQLGQYENAIDALNSAKALDPNDAKTHNYLGCACSQKGWQEVAEKEFRKAIEIDPNFGDAHFNLALVYATSKPPSLELARREYNRALELGIGKDARLEKMLKSTPQP